MGLSEVILPSAISVMLLKDLIDMHPKEILERSIYQVRDETCICKTIDAKNRLDFRPILAGSMPKAFQFRICC